MKFWLNHKTTTFLTIMRMNYAYFKQSVLEYDRHKAGQQLRAVRKKMGLYNLRHAATLFLVMALCLGLYNRWAYSRDFSVLLLSIAGSIVLFLSYILSFYFAIGDFSGVLARLWMGCFIGIISFTEFSPLKDSSVEMVANILFIASLLLKCLWNIVDHFVRPFSYDNMLLRQTEVLEIFGFSAAAFIVAEDTIPLLILIAAFAFTILSIRLRSFFGFINVSMLAVISGLFFFPSLRIRLLINPYGLCCFAGRLLIKPLIEYFFCPQSTLDRWLSFLQTSVLVRHLTVILIAVLELSFLVVSALFIPNHKEWYIVVLMFAACAAFWLCYHSLFVVTMWQLMKKITNCNMTFRYANEESKNMAQIMASKGIRHFSLISKRVTMVTLLSTMLLALVSWETRTAETLSLFLLVFPIEGMVLSLLRAMGTVLGGRCIAYAMVAPAVMQR